MSGVIHWLGGLGGDICCNRGHNEGVEDTVI